MTDTTVANNSEFNRKSMLVAMAAGFGMFVGPTPMASAVASLFMVPLTREFALSRTAISLIQMLQPVTVALVSTWAGHALDRYGVRRVLLPAVLLFAAGNVYMGLTQSLWQLIAGYILLGVCVSVHCYASYTKVLSQWFVVHRGLVMGVAITFGSGLGAVIIPQLASPWIQSHGWRSTYFLLAAIIMLLGFPLLYFFLKEPAFAANTKAQSAHLLEGLTRTEALRTLTFWLIAGVMFLAPMSIVGTLAHSFALLTERGFSAPQAATALSSIYIGGMMGYFTSGTLLERVSSPKIALLYYAAALSGMWILHGAQDARWLVPAAILMGLGQGAEMCVAAYLTSRYFGLKAYGAIYGTFYSIGNAGIAAGIFSMGLAHDIAGSYGPMRSVFLVNLAIVLVICAALPRYRYARERQAPAQAPAQAIS
jgi:MFS family permease